MAQALDSDFARESGAVVSVPHPQGPVRTLACPVRAGPQPLRAAPALGEHTDTVLRRAGYDQADIDDLRRQSVL